MDKIKKLSSKKRRKTLSVVLYLVTPTIKQKPEISFHFFQKSYVVMKLKKEMESTLRTSWGKEIRHLALHRGSLRS